MPGTAADPAPHEVDLTASVYVALGRLVRGLRQEATGSAVGPGGLSALVTLDSRGPLRVGALAEAEAVAAPSMTRIINALETEGLAVRAPDPADGRAQVVAITAAGSRLLASGKEAKLAALHRRIQSLPPHDRERLRAALPALEQLGSALVATR